MPSEKSFYPKTEADVADAVLETAKQGDNLRIVGGGTRLNIGRAAQCSRTMDMSGISGITLYEPAEMIIGAWAGTPLNEIEAALGEKGQMLTFEPMDHRGLLGRDGDPTIGGIVAGNISGPRRIYGGAARDSLIGVRFVNGRGEIVKNGGRVMKNVTGLDLVKLQAGAWGTLGVLTEVIFKVLPKPEVVQTLAFSDLDDRTAVAAMCAAVGTSYEVTGVAHVSGPGNNKSGAKTWMRLEGMAKSVAYRMGKLSEALSDFGVPSILEGDISDEVWRLVRDVHHLHEPRERAIWRVSLPPTKGPEFVAASRALNYYFDWSGGLVWLSVDEENDASAELIQSTAAALGGHATLVRGSEELRSRISVFQPQPQPLAIISQNIKNSFDPDHLINPGLMVSEG